MRPQYTSTVTPQYKAATKGRNVRYFIKDNFDRYPEVREDYLAWRAKQNPIQLQSATFAGIFHPGFKQPMFDIRNAEIREDWGQRNALLEQGRKKKILGMAKNFDPKMFEPISIDYIEDEDSYIIRDGGGRAHAGFLCGIYNLPATVRYVKSFKESRRLFNAQDKFSAAISSHDKFLQQLAEEKHSRHNVASGTWNIARSSGFSLHFADKSTSEPLVEGIGVLQRIIRVVGGDAKGVGWDQKRAPNVAMAMDAIKHAFPNNDEVPASVLEALTAFVHVSKNRIPSGDEGIRRLKKFVVDVRDSDEKLQDINKWTKNLGIDSSNHYATYGASELMKKWNELHKYKNNGIRNKSTYRWVKWTKEEIQITKMNIMQFARDESLLPE